MCSLQNGNSRYNGIKVTKKVKLHDGSQLGFPYAAQYPVNLKDMTIEFCAVDRNESVSATFWAIVNVFDCEVINSTRDFSKRGPGICHPQNGNSRWPCSQSLRSSA